MSRNIYINCEDDAVVVINTIVQPAIEESFFSAFMRGVRWVLMPWIFLFVVLPMIMNILD